MALEEARRGPEVVLLSPDPSPTEHLVEELEVPVAQSFAMRSGTKPEELQQTSDSEITSKKLYVLLKKFILLKHTLLTY